MAPRGASGPKRMRSTDNSSFESVFHRLANAEMLPSERTRTVAKLLMYASEKAPTEKRFSATDLRVSHESEIRRRSGSTSAMRSGGMTSKLAPSRSARRHAWRRSARAGPSREHPGFLADFQRRESEINIERQAIGARLIKHSAAAVVVGQLAKAPHQFLRASRRADGVAERNPAAARHLVHDEGVAVIAEEQALVPAQRSIGHGEI